MHEYENTFNVIKRECYFLAEFRKNKEKIHELSRLE